MKILHLCSYYGGSTVHRDLYRELDSIGIVNYIYAPLRYNRRNKLGNHLISFKCNDSKIVYSILLKWYHTLFFRLKINCNFKDVQKKISVTNCDLIHAITWFSDGALAFKLYKKYNKDYIITIRDTDINAFYRIRRDLRGLGYNVLKYSKNIIFISNSYKNLFFDKIVCDCDKKNFSEKSLVIPNGISPEWFSGCRSKLKPNEILKIGFVGNLTKRKNPLMAWNAVQLLNKQNCPAVLRIAGDGPYRDHLENKMYLDLCGHISSIKKLKTFYDDCDIFLLPSLTETFGLVYLEAMSRGLPVLYTKGEGFDDLFHEGEVGYHVDPRDPQDMADKVKLCLSDYIPMSQRCVSNIKDFHWSNIARRYQEIYNDII